MGSEVPANAPSSQPDPSLLCLPHNPSQEHKFFDSADWAMAKEGQKKEGPPGPPPEQVEQLPPKLEPTPVPTRRVSHLDPLDKIPS